MTNGIGTVITIITDIMKTSTLYLVSVSILTGAVRQVGRTSNPKKSGSANLNRSKAFKDLPELLLLAALPGIERANSGRCLWKNW